MKWYRAGAVCLAALLSSACNGEKAHGPVGPAVLPSAPVFAAGTTGGVNLDQWANGKTPPTGESWQNGNLNGNNSAYGEDKVVPFRLAVEDLSATPPPHFITIEHDFTANGSKAYDFLASADVTETTIFSKICAAGGGAVSSLCGSSTGTMPGTVPFVDIPLPADPFAGAAGKTVDNAIIASGMGAVRKFRVYGISNATQVSISAISHAGDVSGNSVGQFLVTFSPDVNKTAVLMVWGGHLATSGYWDAPTVPKGASTISGAPWHMRTLNLDGGGAANQDRSIQPSALVPPVLSITKVANRIGPVNAGDNIGFDVTVTNNGPGSAFNVVISDALPGGTGINWSTSTVGCAVNGSAPNQTLDCTINTLLSTAGSNTFTASVTSGTTTGPSGTCGTITNSGALASATNAAQVASGPASVIVNCADVGISKSAVASPVNAGSNIAFDITVTNTGSGPATNVTFNDVLPTSPAGLSWAIVSDPSSYCSITSGTLSCTVASLAATTGSYTVRVQSPTTLATCGQVSNQANLTSPRSQIATASLTINCPVVAIAKTSVNGSVNAGDNVAFDIVVSNTGLGTAANVGFTDNLPSFGGTWTIASQDATVPPLPCSIAASTLTCSGLTLAPTTGSYTVRVQTTTDGSVCTTVENTANLTSPYSGSSKASVTVNCPNVGIAKTAVSGTVNAGGNAQFDITVSNTGLAPATNVGLTDALPSFGGTWSVVSQTGPGTPCTVTGTTLTCSGITLPATTGSYTVRVQSTTDGSVCTAVENTANLTSPYSGSSKASVTVNCPKITLAKTADAVSVVAGSQIGFTVTVSNSSAAGTGTATGVTVNDPLPSGSGISWSLAASVTGWTIDGTAPNQTLKFGPASLAAGASSSVHVISNTTAASCKKYDNTASAKLDYAANPSDASASTTVKCLPTLIVTKTIVGGGTQLFDFSQTTATNTSYSLTNTGSKTTSNIQPGTYTVCEVFLAVSWSATATLDNVAAALTNPNAADNPAQDLGTRCVSVTLGYDQTRTVAWTNKPPPGGDARTIGYWKNWSSCSGGGQYTKAVSRNLASKTLDGNLPQTVGILTLTKCQPAVYILDKSDLSGKKMSSDPAYNLAAQLLAALLNKNAGAAVCAVAGTNITAAQSLLVNVSFNGTGTYLKKLNPAQATQANLLATKLDQYNNNNPVGCQ